jgi:hypothetical protein
MLATAAPTVVAQAQAPVLVEGIWDGPYRPIPPDSAIQVSGRHSCCEIAHAVLIGKPGKAQGKVLIIQVSGRRWLWDPAAPTSVQQDSVLNEGPVEDLFCSCHSVDGVGNVVVQGGVRTIPYVPPGSSPPPCPQSAPFCGRHPVWSYVFNPTTREWTNEIQMKIPQPTPPNFGYYYPSSVRLPDGRVLSVGGGSSPLTAGSTPNTCCDANVVSFANGWQVFDPATAAWLPSASSSYYPGLQSPFEFHYYPLMTLMPGSAPNTGFVFGSVITRYDSNTANTGYTPARAPSAYMTLFGPSGTVSLGQTPWTTISGQIDVPQTSGPPIPRNLYYPSGFLWPLQLDNQGRLAGGSPRRLVMVGGCDGNDYLSGAAGAQGYVGVAGYPGGGRRTNTKSYTIDDPEIAGADWNDSFLPGPQFPRIHANTVLTPDDKVFLVGGANYDNLAYAGQGAADVWRKERIADPIFVPETLDLSDPWAPPTQWVSCNQHVSPRLYHSVALLLPDARILVGGGYRGNKNVNLQGVEIPPVNPEHFTWHNWRVQHSNFEVYSPDYLQAGHRPEIVAFSSTVQYGQPFEVTVARAGTANPVAAIGSVSLISPGSVTHHFDFDQRHVKLHFQPSAASPTTRIVITPPADRYLAPPGYYMLFVTTSVAQGSGYKIPSIAKFVQIL